MSPEPGAGSVRADRGALPAGCTASAGSVKPDAGHADAPPAGWEYLHILIPLDRGLDTYRKSDEQLLKPIADAGADGWELVSANEPANGQLQRGGRASVEFFLKRPRR